MVKRSIVLGYFKNLEASALIVNGVLQDFFIESDIPAPGQIYRATVDRPIKGQGGYFLKTPDGSAFLRQGKGLAQGSHVLVQVSGFAESGKAMPVSRKILLKSRYVIVTPENPGLNISRQIKNENRREELVALIRSNLDDFKEGLILRSSCQNAADEEILDDTEEMLSLAEKIYSNHSSEQELILEADKPHTLAWREWSENADVFSESGSFETFGVLDLLEQLKSERVETNDGHYFVETTKACATVDINTGSDTSPAAALKANLAVAHDLPRQLRLRGIGGQIIIDPAPISKKDRKIFDQALRIAFRKDTVETNIVGWTAMGLIEIQRARVRSSWR